MSNILAVSLDIDGCLFNNNYHELLANGQSRDQAVLNSNKSFLQELKQAADSYHHTVSFIGSNRQSIPLDYMNASPKGEEAPSGSCFPAMVAVSEEIGAKFDKMLLSDIKNNKDFGTNFKIAQEILNNNTHYDDGLSPQDQLLQMDCDQDSKKMLLIYAQIHKIAKDYPNDTITFEFYDDRQDILDSLQKFYGVYNYLIPKNVKLGFNNYAGNDISPYRAIQGTGHTDRQFAASINKLVSNYKANHPEDFVDGIGTIKPLDDLILIDLDAIETRLKNINIPVNDPDRKLILELQNRIQKEIEDYKGLPTRHKLNPNSTIFLHQRCIHHLNKIDKRLNTQSSWKPFLKNLALMLTVVGIPLAVYSMGVRLSEGHYSVFNKPKGHNQQSRLDSVREMVSTKAASGH